MAEGSTNKPRDNNVKGVVALLGLALVVYVGVLIRSNLREYRFIGRPDNQIYTITVSGKGEITAVPDVAEISLGSQVEAATVAAAQEENTKRMNGLIDKLKALDIDKEDIQTTGYNVYPQYDYSTSRQILRGYTVSQQVLVKIRDLTKVGDALSLISEQNLNQVGSLNFTIDDPEELMQQAREEALANAKEKAEALARVAGTKLGRLVSFSENGGGEPVPYNRNVGIAYDMEESAKVAPTVEPGSQDIIVYATVTYEVN